MNFRDFIFGMIIGWGILYNVFLYFGEPFSSVMNYTGNIIVIFPHWFNEFLFGFGIFFIGLWFAIWLQELHECKKIEDAKENED